MGVDDVWGRGAVHNDTQSIELSCSRLWAYIRTRSVVEGHTARQNLLVELGRCHHRRPRPCLLANSRTSSPTLIVAVILWLMHETTCVCADTRGRGPEDGGNPFGVLAQVRQRVTSR